MQYKIPETMRAMVLTGPGKFEVQTVPVPVPGPEEVLCRIGGVAICGSDPEIFRGISQEYGRRTTPLLQDTSGQDVLLL